MAVQNATASITANSSVTATAKGHYAVAMTAAVGATVTATAKCHYVAAMTAAASATFTVPPPTITYHFKPIATTSVTVPVVRPSPQPAITSSSTIQPAKGPTLAGPSVAVNVKR
jgi:hypothetical protein